MWLVMLGCIASIHLLGNCHIRAGVSGKQALRVERMHGGLTEP